MKTHKIKGIGIMLGALTPAIAIIAIVLLTISIVLDTRELLAGPVVKVNQGLASIKNKVSDTTQILTKVPNPIANIQTKIANTAQKIKRIPEEINLPALSIPDINLKIKPKVSLASRKVQDRIQSAESSPYQDIHTIAHAEDISPFLLKQPNKRISEPYPAIYLASLGDQIALGGFGDVIKKGKDVGKKAGGAVKDTVKKVKPPKIEWQNLQVKMPSVPATRVPVPGLKQAKQLLSKNLNLLGELKNFLGVIQSLDSIKNLVNSFAIEREKISSLVKPIFTKGALLLFLVLTLIAIMIIAVYVIPYVTWLYSLFNRGLTLYRGKVETMI